MPHAARKMRHLTAAEQSMRVRVAMKVCRRQHLHFKCRVVSCHVLGSFRRAEERFLCSNPRELCASIHHVRMVTFVIILLQQLLQSKTASTTKGSHLPKTRMAKMMSQSRRTRITRMALGERPRMAKAGTHPIDDTVSPSVRYVAG